MLVLPGVWPSLPLEEVIAFLGVKKNWKTRYALTIERKHFVEKEAIAWVSDSLPCLWRDTFLFSALNFGKSLARQQHAACASTAGVEVGSAELHSLWIVQAGQTVTEYNSIIQYYRIAKIIYTAPRGASGYSKEKGWDTLWPYIQHSPSEWIRIYENVSISYKEKLYTYMRELPQKCVSICLEHFEVIHLRIGYPGLPLLLRNTTYLRNPLHHKAWFY